MSENLHDLGSTDLPPEGPSHRAARSRRSGPARGLVTEAASRAGRDLKLADASRAWLDEAAEAGASDLDFSAVVATILGHRAHA